MKLDSVRLKGRGRQEGEGGFTLIELLTVIVILGILLGIASGTWFSVIDSRRVDSAANQLASDLRLAHTRAENQLLEWHLVYSHDDATYTLVRPSPNPIDTLTVNRSFEEAKVLNSEVGGGGTIKFKPTGSAQIDGFADADGDEELDITVSTADGDPRRVVSLNTATSRVELD